MTNEELEKQSKDFLDTKMVEIFPHRASLIIGALLSKFERLQKDFSDSRQTWYETQEIQDETLRTLQDAYDKAQRQSVRYRKALESVIGDIRGDFTEEEIQGRALYRAIVETIDKVLRED